MNLKLLYTILLAMIVPHFVKAQMPILKYVIIDTLVDNRILTNESYDRYDNDAIINADIIDSESRKDATVTGGYWNIEKYEKWSKPYPAVNAYFRYLKGNIINLYIRIDDKGSLLEINNLPRIWDIIRIKKWVLYHNCLTDSAKGGTYFFLYKNDSLRKYRKDIEWCKTTTQNCNDTLKYINVDINNISYRIPLQIRESEPVTIGHGTANKRNERRRHEYPHKRKFKYFVTEIHRKLHYYKGEICF